MTPMQSPLKNRLSTRELSPSRLEYVARINRVLDYIDAHLADVLTLKVLADVACFSPFHFHRIFAAMTGERLFHFIKRLRLEKAAAKLIIHPHTPITEIALDTGFGSSAAFARAFKDAFGVSASAWRQRKIDQMNRKDDQTGRKERKEINDLSAYFDDETNNHQRRKSMKVEADEFAVKTLDAVDVAYVRYIGPYAGNETLFKDLFERLGKWAGPRGLMGPDAQWISVYHDDPGITDEESLRTSICLTVPEETEAEGEIGRMTLAGGQYAVGRFVLTPEQYGGAWQAMCADYLPESGWQPEDKPPFERYLNNPEEHPEGKHIVEICIPVKPL